MNLQSEKSKTFDLKLSDQLKKERSWKKLGDLTGATSWDQLPVSNICANATNSEYVNVSTLSTEAKHRALEKHLW